MILQLDKDFGIVLKEDLDTEILTVFDNTFPKAWGFIKFDISTVPLIKRNVVKELFKIFEKEYDLIIAKGYLPKLTVEVVAYPVITHYSFVGYTVTDIISAYLVETYLVFNRKEQEIMRLNTSEIFSYNLAVQIRKVADKEELVTEKCTLLKYENGKLLFNQLKDYEL